MFAGAALSAVVLLFLSAPYGRHARAGRGGSATTPAPGSPTRKIRSLAAP